MNFSKEFIEKYMLYKKLATIKVPCVLKNTETGEEQKLEVGLDSLVDLDATFNTQQELSKIEEETENNKEEIEKEKMDKEQEKKELIKKLITIIMEENGNYYLTNYRNRDNCDFDCKGWDGFSRRCECGNRRISWRITPDQDDLYYKAW